MATMHTTTTARGNIISGILHGIGGLFSSIFDVMLNLAESNRRAKEIERLNAMSDEQLAARGLKRTDIVRYVFRDMLYI